MQQQQLLLQLENPFADVSDLGGNNWGNDLVNAPEVWNRGFTGEGVTVAVIDSGVDITHTDLRDNIWTNTNEIVNDGIDNDGNGYVDDIYGWNFGIGQYNNNVMPGTNDPGQAHGTHVAGTIAAMNDDSGMTGVAHNAEVMALRLGDVNDNSFINAGNLAEAIRYAVDNGANVINMSLGWSDSFELQEALAYAASNDVITISSSGNSGLPSPGNPASYATEFGVSVGAVDRYGSIADFSNGAGSDSSLQHVVAPGVAVHSTMPGNNYGEMSGTSMAAPHVAGVVALMLSANPNLTHDQVREILTSSATMPGGTNNPFRTFSQVDTQEANNLAMNNDLSVADKEQIVSNEMLNFINELLTNTGNLASAKQAVPDRGTDITQSLELDTSSASTDIFASSKGHNVTGNEANFKNDDLQLHSHERLAPDASLFATLKDELTLAEELYEFSI